MMNEILKSHEVEHYRDITRRLKELRSKILKAKDLTLLVHKNEHDKVAVSAVIM